jgi:UDPglucose 6-dehydrogenase
LNLAVIGTGYVGLVTGVCYSEVGNQVTCVDIDQQKIKKLQQGKIPIYEPGLETLLIKNTKKQRLRFTSQLHEAITAADVVIIAVGTPPKANGEADLQYIETAAKSIGHCLTNYKVIVTKSTVPIGTGQRIKKMIQEAAGHSDFDIASNPEFLREGSAINDTFQMERAIIGVESAKAAAILEKLHEPFQTNVVVTDVETAEITKYAANAFLATKISFMNEIANLCEITGANIEKVSEGLGYDHRIGKAFLQAGVGYGGSCFPKDTQALIKMSEMAGYHMNIVPAAERVNQQQRVRLFDKVCQAFGKDQVKGKRVSVLGLSFKPNTDDVRAAPSLDLIPLLQKEGAYVVAYDPIAMANAKRMVKHLRVSESLQEAITDANALLILTDWEEFKKLDLAQVKRSMKQPIIIDGRNIFDPDHLEALGFYYDSIGRKKVDGRKNGK